MTSLRQREANRRNARKSTGPRTLEGKNRSRLNAVRHGLTAETLIVSAEDAAAYAAHEIALLDSISPETTVERELALYLASLLWRLRRATQFETGLLQIQHDVMHEMSENHADRHSPEEVTALVNASMSLVLHQTLRTPKPSCNRSSIQRETNGHLSDSCPCPKPFSETSDAKQAARAFLRLAHLDNDILERLIRYESKLWRRVTQTVHTLGYLRRQRPAT